MTRKSPKIVCFSDVHAHEHREFASLNPISTRLQECLAGLRWLREEVIPKALREASEVTVLFLGDLFHSKRSVSTVVLSEVVKEFGRWPESWPVVHGIPGNHDIYDANGTHHLLEPLKKGWCLYPSPGVLVTGAGIEVWMIPFRRTADEIRIALAELHHKHPVKGAGMRILVLHGILNHAVAGVGARVLPPTIELTEQELAPFKLVLVGDIHKHQHYERVVYPGALLQHNFGDEGDARGCLVVSCGAGSFTWEHVPNPTSPAFLTKQIQVLSDLQAPASATETTYLHLRLADPALRPGVEKWLTKRNAAGYNTCARVTDEPLGQALQVRSGVTLDMSPLAVIERWAQEKGGDKAEALTELGRQMYEAAVSPST